MDDDLLRTYRRWQALEEEGRDEDADRTFESVFKAAVAPLPVPLEFGAQTMAAVGAAAERDARRARRARQASVAGGIVGGAAATYFGAAYLLTGVSAIFTRLLDFMIVGVVYLATAMQSGTDAWSVAASLGRATAALAGDPRVVAALVMIQAVAVAAFVALRRLLDSDVELLK